MDNSIISTDRVFALYQSQSPFPIDFDDAWHWIGYSRRNNAKRALLSCGFEEGIDLLINEQLGTLDDPKPEECIMLTVDCFKMWAMMAGTEKGRETRIYFLECERKLKLVACSAYYRWVHGGEDVN
jgi:phage anti-repressor protein